MKKILSIIGAIGLGASAPAPLLANAPTTKQSEEKATDIITIDGVEYQKEKINGITGNVIFVAVDSKDNVYFGTDTGAFVLKHGETTPNKINGFVDVLMFYSISVDSKDNVYFETDKGAYKLTAGSDTPTKINDINKIPKEKIIAGKDSKGNLYKIIHEVLYKLIPYETPPAPLSNIAIAGIAIGSVAGVAFVVLGSCYLYQYLNKKKKASKK